MDERALTAQDAAEVTTLLSACDIAVVGFADFSPEEIEADLRAPGSQRVGWFADGELVAYGWARQTSDSNKVELDAYVHPRIHDDQIGVDLITRLEQAGRQAAADAGHDVAVFDIGAYQQDERTAAWLRARGFHVGTSFVRMRIDFDSASSSTDSSSDLSAREDRIRVREADKSERELRLAHEIDEASFGAHYGQVSVSFDAYRRSFEEHGADWARLWFAEVDGEAAGILVGTRQFESDENAGFVRRLGVHPDHRGEGLGRSLLRHYFQVCRDEGRVAALLHVDVANVTNALALYELVGMRPVLRINAWQKESPTKE